ncbi:hypothetical protein CYJ10_11915 [Cupriavidus pauculus]|uniref:Uncharacterized protein n=1 Tax=Cupriavidus pauculus TaxID=82633 RepID=A0A2N5CE49_9BURK|nr:hypothetical protein CYJ10_11915 [Cupriavidus pauculus]
MEAIVEKLPNSNYKGFDIYPLVYRFDPPRKWCERRRHHDNTFTASVLICREGLEPTTEFARVVQLRTKNWKSAAEAQRAALTAGQEIIDDLLDRDIGIA